MTELQSTDFSVIDFGKRSNVQDCAFIWMYSISPDKDKMQVLIQLRKDALFGSSAGGSVDDGETIIDGALREMLEEIGYSNIREEELEPINTYKLHENDFHIHSFAYEVTEGTLKFIQSTFQSAQCSYELLGLNIIPFGTFAKTNKEKLCPANILEQHFSCTAKHELKALLSMKGFLGDEKL